MGELIDQPSIAVEVSSVGDLTFSVVEVSRDNEYNWFLTNGMRLVA
jgi:hypothetical protein